MIVRLSFEPAEESKPEYRAFDRLRLTLDKLRLTLDRLRLILNNN